MGNKTQVVLISASFALYSCAWLVSYPECVVNI